MLVVGVVRRRDERRRELGLRACGVGGTEMGFEGERCCFCLGDCLDLFFGVSAMGAVVQ